MNFSIIMSEMSSISLLVVIGGSQCCIFELSHMCHSLVLMEMIPF